MSDLAAMQREFMAHVLEEERDLPDGWNARHHAGMAIYRGGYRARMVDTIAESCERTRRLAGEDAFRQAAINHVIAKPSSGWSIDDVGSGFGDTLRQLYPERPELAELAEIEEAMQVASRATDMDPLTAEGFSAQTAEFGEQDWANLGLAFLPGLAILPATYAWVPVWQALAEGEPDMQPDLLAETASLVIWREDEQPVFVMLSQEEGQALLAMQDGQSFAELCAGLIPAHGEQNSAAVAGGMLGQWLQNGFVGGIA